MLTFQEKQKGIQAASKIESIKNFIVFVDDEIKKSKANGHYIYDLIAAFFSTKKLSTLSVSGLNAHAGGEFTFDSYENGQVTVHRKGVKAVKGIKAIEVYRRGEYKQHFGQGHSEYFFETWMKPHKKKIFEKNLKYYEKIWEFVENHPLNK